MGCLSLADYVKSVTDLLDTETDAATLVGKIVPLKRRLLENPELVPTLCRQGLASVAYTRSLLYADPHGRFSVLGLVWSPERESPIHDHPNWGVVGVWERSLRVTDYREHADGNQLAERERRDISAGDVLAIVPPRTMNIHKMANPFGEPAVSIHTYGDRALLCRAFNPVTGRGADVNLKFHHVVDCPTLG